MLHCLFELSLQVLQLILDYFILQLLLLCDSAYNVLNQSSLKVIFWLSLILTIKRDFDYVFGLIEDGEPSEDKLIFPH